MNKHFCKPIAMLLSLVVVFSAIMMAIPAFAATPSNTGYQFFLSNYLIDESPFAQRLVNGEERAPSRQIVELKKDDPEWNFCVTGWLLSTMGITDFSSSSDKAVGFYETILFDVFCDAQTSEDSIFNLLAASKATQAEVSNIIVSTYGNILGESVKELQNDTELYEQINNTIKNTERVSNALEIIGDISEYGSNLSEIITNCSRLQAVAGSYANSSRILKDISLKTNDINLKCACQRFETYLNEAVGSVAYASVSILEDTIYALSDYVIEELWDEVVTSLTSYGFYIETGREIGKLASNFLFSTEPLIEHYYAMLALYEFENCLDSCVQTYQTNYKNSKTFKNSTLFNEGFILLAKTITEGCDYAEKYYEITYEEGLVNNIINMFNTAVAWFKKVTGSTEEPPKRDYQITIEKIGRERSMIAGLVDFVNNDSYNCYIKSIKESEPVKNEIVVVEYIPPIITEEEVVEYTEEVHEISRQFSNHYFNSSTTLTEDLTVYGNAYMSANVDLNGYTLNIMGNLYQTGGTMTINNGMLNVAGDYRIQKETVNNAGEMVYSPVSAYLTMNNEKDTVNIAGSFITRSSNYHDLYAGTMSVGGDIYDWSGDIEASGTHKTVLNGTEKQTIHFEFSSSYFNVLEATNTDIECTGYFSAKSLGSNITITSNGAKMWGIDLNGKTLTINGDVEMTNYVDINGGTMTVNGNLRQTGGSLTVNNGTLNVTGDYIMQKESLDNTGETVYSSVSAYLTMKNVKDTVNIAGSFITRSSNYHDLYAGTMSVGGDIYDWDDDIEASGTHKTVLNGTEKQTIHFEYSSSYFNVLEATNTNIECTGYFCAKSLGSNITITSNGAKIWGIDLNGKTLTINGDVEMTGGIDLNGGTMTVNGNLRQTGGSLTVNNGTLNVTGDYIMQKESLDNTGETVYSSVSAYLTMKNVKDTVNIAGSFITRSSNYHDLYAGTMSVGGDIYDWDDDIEASGTHKTVLNGTEKQTIHFEYSSSYFNVLEATNTNIECTGYFCAKSLGSNITITSNGAKIYGINLSGKTLTINGDVEMTGSVNINGGTMTVNGNLRQTYGTLTVNNGTLNVTGDYIMQTESLDNTGETVYSSVSAYLTMKNVKDTVNIAGSFITRSSHYHTLTAGTMSVGGDIYDWDNDIEASGTHKTVLNGSEKQTIYFYGGYSCFNVLEATNTNIECTGYFCAKSLGSNITITSNGAKIWGIDLNGKTLTINGDVEMTNYVDINGGTMTVNGNLRQTYGTLTVNNGTLNVTGDYIMQTESLDNTGETVYSSVSAYLTMKNEKDTVNIAGSFITRSSHYHTLTAGTMSVGGDIYDWDNDIEASGTHKTVLNGTEKQTIDFYGGYSCFNVLEATNTDIECTGCFSAKSLGSNITITSNGAKMWGIDLNGKTLTINGDVEMTNYVDINGGTIAVNGNLRQTHGTLTVNNGMLNVTGDYIMQTESLDNTGETVYSSVSAYLTMKNEKDTVNIAGSFITRSSGSHTLTAGTMSVGGDIYDWANDIEASGTHKTVLNGTEKQTVYFDSSYSRFNILELTQPRSNYSFTPDNCWNKLIEKPKSPVPVVIPGNGQVTLKWDSVMGATKYNVYTCQNDTFKLQGTTTDNSYIVKNLTNGTTYGFLVQALINGVWSSYTSADIVYATPIDPTKPQNITATAVSSTSVKLTWDAVESATKYAIAYQNGTKFTTLSATCTSTTYTATGLTAGKTYKFLVQAYVDGQWSSYTTDNLVSVTLPANTKPQNITAVAVSSTSAKLTWDEVSGATKYAIAYQNGTKFTTLTTSCTSTTYTATGLTAGKTYNFLVQAYVGGKWSAFTTDDLVSVTLPANTKPQNVKATAVSSTSAKLTWDAVAGATKYAIAYQNGTKYTTLTTSCTSTTYTETGLTAGKTYKFLVQAYVGGKWSAFTTDDLVSVTLTTSTKPQNVKAVAVSSTSAKLTWDAVAGATKYAIAYQNGTKYTTLTTSCTSTTYTATGLTAGKTYKFLVQAYVGGKWSAFTTEDLVSVTLTASTKPQNVKAVAVSSTSAKLTWDAVAGATKYAIAYQNGTKYTTLSATCTSTTYTATGLTAGATYKFLVQAYVGGKWSAFTTDDLVSVTLTTSTKPQNVKATAVSSTSAKLTWDAVAGATKYAIAYQNGTKYTTLTTSCASTTYTATGLTAGKTYKFLVQAYVGGKWSAFTTEDFVSVTLTTSTKPQNVKATALSSTSVKLTWDAVAGATKYAIAYQNGTKYTTLTTSCTSTTYTATGLTAGKTYKFLVQAYVGGKWSAFTTDDLVSVTLTASTKPQNVKATALSSTSVKLTWDAVAGATKYAIAYQNGTKYTTLTTSCTSTTYTATGLTAGKTYKFLVQAYVGGKWSAFTTEDLVSVTTMA